MSRPSSLRRGGAGGAAILWVLLLAGQASALDVGDAPPNIDLPDQKGVRVELANLRGKLVIVDFWASWCAPCKQEMPELEKLYRKYAEQGLVVIAVNIDRSEKKMRNFLKTMPVSFSIVHDKGLALAQQYEPSVMPSSYFVGKTGRVEYIHRGFRKKDLPAIETRIRELLAR